MAVEERTLFRENQAGVAVAHERELHRGQRDGDPRLLQEHLVGVDDALGRDDVLEERLIAVGPAIRRDALAAFLPADAEVELERHIGVDIPARLGLPIGPGRENTLGWRLVLALDDEAGVLHRSSAHRLPPFGSSLPSARYSPRRSRRRSKLDRRAPIHRSTGRSAAGSIRQVRTRPTFSELTRPLTCSTCRCWTTGDSDIGSGSASSLTVAGPRLNRSTMPLLAREAANGQDIRLWGGAQAIQQYMAAGLLDVLELHVVPVLLGGGARLFENLGGADVRLEQVRAVEAPGVTHVKYRVRSGS